MQNTKNTILILVIIGLFVASGVVVYRGFFANANIPSISVGTDTAPVKNVMPYGSALDLTRVQQRAATADTYRYEVVDPASVGVAVQNLITPPVSTTPANRR